MMLWQTPIELDTRQDANTSQPAILDLRTTDFFGMQNVPRDWWMALTEQESPRAQLGEMSSGQILDEIFEEYAVAWRRLADL